MPLQYQLAYTYEGLILYLCIILSTIAICKLTYRWKIPNVMWKCTLSISFVLLAIAVLLGYADHYDDCMMVYFFSLIFSEIGYIGCIVNKITFKRTNIIQMTVICTATAIWYISAMISPVTIKEYPSIIYSGAVNIVIAEAYWLSQIRKMKFQISVHDKKWLLVLLLIICGLSVNTLTSVPMWDELYYIQGIRSAARWEFTPGTFSKLNLVAHKSAGYTLFSEMGVWLFRDEVVGVHIVQLLMLLSAVCAFWRIITIKFPDIDKIEKVLVTALYAFSPALFGMLPYINVDYPVLIFLTWLFCCYYSKWHILEFVSALLLCFSKETALFIYAGFVIGVYIVRLHENHNVLSFKKIIHSFKLIEYIKYFIPAVLWLLFFIIAEVNYEKLGVWGSAAGDYLRWQGRIDNLDNYLNSVGWSTTYAINQLNQMFLMNFMWLLSIGIIVFIVIYITGKRYSKIGGDIIPLFSAVGGFVVITLIFITHNHYRYKVAVDILMILLFVFFVQAVIFKTGIRKMIFGVISVLFLIQSFWNWDPITNRMGRLIDLGKQKVMNYDIGFGDGVCVSDYIIYNRQASEWGKAVENMLCSIEMDEHVLILLPKLPVEAVYQVFGGFSQQSLERAGIYVDQEKRDFRTFLSDENYERVQYGEIQEDGSVIGSDATYSIINIDVSNYDKLYYIKLPFVSDEVNQATLNSFNRPIFQEKKIEYGLCCMEVLIF